MGADSQECGPEAVEEDTMGMRNMVGKDTLELLHKCE
jgi:hypothetical protein